MSGPGTPGPGAQGGAGDGAGDGVADGSVRERIERAWPQLSPVERRLAELVLEHAEDLAGYTGAELADASGTSKASVSRFFRRLGFDSFAQARADARGLRARGVPLGGLPQDAGDAVALHLAHDARNLSAAAQALDRDALEAAARLLAGARRVVVAGWRNSYPVALHLREQLLQARADVALVPQPGQTVAEEVASLGERDAFVLVAFRRRPPAVAAVLGHVSGLGVPSVVLADPTARPATAAARHRFEVPVDGPGAFDSYAAATAVVAVLAEAVLARCGARGRARRDAVARAHEALSELEVR